MQSFPSKACPLTRHLMLIFHKSSMIFTSLLYEHKFCSSVLMQMLSPVISTRACVGRGRVWLFLNTASITCHTSQTLDDKKKVFERYFIGSMCGIQVMYVSAGKHICCTGVYLWTSTSFPCSSTPIHSRIYRGKQQRFHEQSMPSPIKTFKTVITWCQLCQHFLYEQALRIQAGLAKDCKHFISLYSFSRVSLKASINPNLQQLSRFFYCNPQHCEKNRP